MSEEIKSPPYPGEWVSVDGVFQALRELRAWAAYYRPLLNKAIGQELIPEPIRIPGEGDASGKYRYQYQPVVSQHQHLMFTRRVRERWDALVRKYEDAWDCQECVRLRAMLVQMAVVMLNNAFTPHERREHNGQSEADQMTRAFQQLHDVFQRLAEPEAELAAG